MSKLQGKCLVDTNVPKVANKSSDNDLSEVGMECVLACVKAIQHVTNSGSLIIDAGDEIFEEYCKQLNRSGSPGVGDEFLKWVNDNRWSLPAQDRVKITKNGDSYDEFPDHPELSKFDRSDRKFVAVANAHMNKPPILQATDSKWWGWKDALFEVGIEVFFLCETYVKEKYAKKMGA